jgi:ligand-binding sensor domain-containing protein
MKSILILLTGLLAGSGALETGPALQISQHIRSIVQDRAGNFWFGTDGEGVYRYDGKSFTGFTEKEGLCGNFVRTISEDKSGKLWFSTRDGVCRYDGTSFTHFNVEGRLGTGEVKQDGAEDLWFGTNGGVYRYDGSSFAYFPLPEAGLGSRFLPGALPDHHSSYSVYSLLEDKAGNLWFGTESQGVARYDGKAVTYFTEKGLSKAAVRSIFQDRKGNLWFGNNGLGVYRYDGVSLTHFTEEKGLGNNLGNNEFLETLKGKPGTLARVWTIAEDKAGNLWFGTIDAGAWRYDGKTLTNFTTRDGLGSDSIWTLYKDKAGDLWFGTDGGGVYKYDGKSFHEVKLRQ